MKGMVPTPASSARPPRFGIAELAHRLYEERGRQEGHHLEDWIEAERRISDKQVRTRKANSQRTRAAARRTRNWARRRIRLDRNGNGAAR